MEVTIKERQGGSQMDYLFTARFTSHEWDGLKALVDSIHQQAPSQGAVEERFRSMLHRAVQHADVAVDDQDIDGGRSRLRACKEEDSEIKS